MSRGRPFTTDETIVQQKAFSDAEMAAYDRLPPEWRRLVSEEGHCFLAQHIAGIYVAGRTLAEVRQWVEYAKSETRRRIEIRDGVRMP